MLRIIPPFTPWRPRGGGAAAVPWRLEVTGNWTKRRGEEAQGTGGKARRRDVEVEGEDLGSEAKWEMH